MTSVRTTLDITRMFDIAECWHAYLENDTKTELGEGQKNVGKTGFLSCSSLRS